VGPLGAGGGSAVRRCTVLSGCRPLAGPGAGDRTEWRDVERAGQGRASKQRPEKTEVRSCTGGQGRDARGKGRPKVVVLDSWLHAAHRRQRPHRSQGWRRPEVWSGCGTRPSNRDRQGEGGTGRVQHRPCRSGSGKHYGLNQQKETKLATLSLVHSLTAQEVREAGGRKKGGSLQTAGAQASRRECCYLEGEESKREWGLGSELGRQGNGGPALHGARLNSTIQHESCASLQASSQLIAAAGASLGLEGRCQEGA
jgi:hypothetical protein